MIVALSTSSPIASIAAFEDGKVFFARQAEARQQASEIILAWFRELNPLLVEGFIADLGPGGFTGTRVAIVTAKTLAFALGVRCAGMSSFDLITMDTAVVPSRRGWYLSRGGMTEGWPEGGIGYGAEANDQVFPLASRAFSKLEELQWVEPDLLMPNYMLEPSISTPKKPFVGRIDNSDVA